MLPESKQPALESSLSIIRGLHIRWCILWDSLDETQWVRRWVHPEIGSAASKTCCKFTMSTAKATWIKSSARWRPNLEPGRTLAGLRP